MTQLNQPNQNKQDQNEEKPSVYPIKRRTLLKALAGVPVLGAFVYELIRKNDFDRSKQNRLVKELGLDEMKQPTVLKSTSQTKTETLRIGIIGFGSRGPSHARGLGYLHPDDEKRRMENDSLKDWLAQENLNVALTGICDVFDLHAERALATAQNSICPGGGTHVKLPVKRYRTYQEMLDDKDIDAIMIATPDHHHADITAAAARAGKHVYCEKSFALNEDELNEAYRAVKESGVTFQLGHQIPQNVIFQQAKKVIEKDILGKITLVETTTNRNTSSGAWIRHLDKQGNPKPGDETSIDWKQWLGKTPEVPFNIDRFYNWTKWFNYDTGLIGQLFTHEYDAVNQLLRIGIPQSATASGGIYYWKDNREMPDSLHCVFEYPERDLTLLYSGSLANSLGRGRVFMGHDASMELGSSISIQADKNSTRYQSQIEAGLIDPSKPMLSFNPNANGLDGVTSATEQYYASRGLISTNVDGKQMDVTYLHIKEWIDCIRSGQTPTANIERAFEESITCLMAHKSYLEGRKVEWDSVNRKII